jgi:hypothetical protein
MRLAITAWKPDTSHMRRAHIWQNMIRVKRRDINVLDLYCDRRYRTTSEHSFMKELQCIIVAVGSDTTAGQDAWRMSCS